MLSRFQRLTRPTFLLLTLTLLCATAVEIRAQGSPASPSQTPNSPPSNARPTPVPSNALPSQLTSDPRAVQQLLAALEFQTKRAENAERERDGWKQQADAWQGLYNAERDRSALLTSANADRREAQEAQRFAVSLLQTQHEEDKSRINLLDAENTALRKSRVKWAFKGAAVGFGTCAASTVPNVFGR